MKKTVWMIIIPVLAVILLVFVLNYIGQKRIEGKKSVLPIG